MFSTKSLVHFVSFFLLLALILSPVSPARAAGVRYAAPSGATSGTCNNWANACTLQYALSSAANGDEIWVKMGVHYPGSNRTDTFTLKRGVALYGGFFGTETALSQRDWQAHKTILSGDIDKDDTNTDGNFIAETTADIQGSNAYHVVTDSGTDNTVILDGFVITAGQANSFGSDALGSGMYNDLSSPSLANLTFSGNFTSYGGGMWNYKSNPTLTYVTFRGNSAGYYGGGMYNYESNPTLINMAFSDNSANYDGGGMYNYESNPTLTNVTFSGNSATSDGGGMYNSETSSPTLTNVAFSGNSATSGGGMGNADSSPMLTNVAFSGNSATHGGGMYNYNSSPTLTNVAFSGNSATSDGGGMISYWYSSPTLTNVTFSGNSATSLGGGMANRDSNLTLTNVTFSGNSASYGGGMWNNRSSPTLTNVIMWDDSASTSGPEIYNEDSYSTPSITYSDIQGGGYSGPGNIDADPLFVDAAGGNLRLQLTSPAIDAGNNAAVPSGVTTDLDGKPRFCDIPTVPNTGNGTPPIVDMGAYEASFTVFLPLVLR